MDSVTVLYIPWILEINLTRDNEIKSLGCELFKVFFVRFSLYDGSTHTSFTISGGISKLELAISFMVHT